MSLKQGETRRNFLKKAFSLGTVAVLTPTEIAKAAENYAQQQEYSWRGAEIFLTQQRADSIVYAFLINSNKFFPILKKLIAIGGYKVNSSKFPNNYSGYKQDRIYHLGKNKGDELDIKGLESTIEDGEKLGDELKNLIASIKNNNKLKEAILRSQLVKLRQICQETSISTEYKINTEWAAAYLLDTFEDNEDSYTFTKELTNNLFKKLESLETDDRLEPIQKKFISNYKKTLDTGKRGDEKTIQEVFKIRYYPLPIEPDEKNKLIYHSLNCYSYFNR